MYLHVDSWDLFLDHSLLKDLGTKELEAIGISRDTNDFL